MKFANYIQREVVNPVDLEILDKTYNTLEQGHQAAIQATSALQTEMAKLDLNEAESAWRQQKIDEIKATLEDNSYMGNVYHALDDLTLLSGDLFSNPELLGRLQAQQDYKTYMAKLDASNLSEDKKEYFREQNPYYYQDKVDVNTGKIIGGTKWEPTDRFVDQYDYTKLYEQAVRMTAKKKGANQTIYYKDAEGNFTPDVSQSVDKLPYYKKDFSYEELRAQDIEETLKALLETNPEAKASIAQDYKISAWKHNNAVKGSPDQLIIDEYTDDNGVELSQQEYIKKMFDPLYRTSSYKHYDSNITALDGLKFQADKYGDSNKNNTELLQDPFLPTTPGPHMKNIHSSVVTTIDTKIAAKETLQGYFNQMGVELNTEDIVGSMQALKIKFDENNQIIPKEVYDAYLKYKKGTDDYNQIMNLVQNQSDKDAITFAAALETATDLSQIPNDNPYKQKYEKFKNLLLNDDKTGYNIYLKDNSYSSAINILSKGNVNNLSELGIEEKIDDKYGTKYLFLNKEKGDNLYFILNKIEDLVSPKYGVYGFHFSAQNITKKFLDNTRKSLDKIDKDIISNIDVAATSEPLVGTTDVIDLMFNSGIIINKEPHKAYSELLGAAQGQNLDMSVSYDGEIGQKVINSAQRVALMNIANAIANDSQLGTISMTFGQESLNNYIKVNIHQRNNDAIKTLKADMKDAGLVSTDGDIKYSYTIVVSNLFNSSQKEKLMANPTFKAGHEFSIKKQSGINNYKMFGNIEMARTDLQGSHAILMSGEPIVMLDAQQSKEAYIAGNKFDDLKYKIYSVGNRELTDEENAYIASEVINMVRALMPTNKNQNAKTPAELDNYGIALFTNLIEQLNTALIQ